MIKQGVCVTYYKYNNVPTYIGKYLNALKYNKPKQTTII